MDEIDGAAREARVSSSYCTVYWRESSDHDEDAPPSPNSSRYVGESGGNGESAIEEGDDGGTFQDDWSHGKEHRDEVSVVILCFLCHHFCILSLGYLEFGAY